MMDRGPWVVQLWSGADLGGKRDRVILQSEDFRHDVALVVSGDFEDFDQKLKYAQELSQALNETSTNEHPVLAVVPRNPYPEVLDAMSAVFLEDFKRTYKGSSLTDDQANVVRELMVRLYKEATGT